MRVTSFFCGDGLCRVFSSHCWVVGVACFLVWAVFLVALGWVERFFYPILYVGGCLLGWDEDGEAC